MYNSSCLQLILAVHALQKIYQVLPFKAYLLLLFPGFVGLHNNIKFVIIRMYTTEVTQGKRQAR